MENNPKCKYKTIGGLGCIYPIPFPSATRTSRTLDNWRPRKALEPSPMADHQPAASSPKRKKKHSKKPEDSNATVDDSLAAAASPSPKKKEKHSKKKREAIDATMAAASPKKKEKKHSKKQEDTNVPEKKREVVHVTVDASLTGAAAAGAAPVVAYFPTGYDPLAAGGGRKGREAPRTRLFRHTKHPSRIELVVGAATGGGGGPDFVGRSYAGEAVLPQLTGYALGVLDKASGTLKVVPIAANKVSTIPFPPKL